MNTSIPTARLCDTAAEKNRTIRRKSKLRAIDQGTPYDAAGRTLKWTRELATGKLGRVTDIVIIARVMDRNGGIAYEHFVNGTSDSVVHCNMADTARKHYL